MNEHFWVNDKSFKSHYLRNMKAFNWQPYSIASRTSQKDACNLSKISKVEQPKGNHSLKM